MANILVVDDEASICVLLSNILKREGHDVFVADNGRQALEICQNTDIELIITDLVMPEQNGIEMILQLRKLCPAVKVIAISGGQGFSGEIDLLSVAQLLGARHVIKKPFTVEQIRGAVADVI